jgi:uncharacterized CHY-type Zn-finger protein
MKHFRIQEDGTVYHVEKRIDVIGLRFWAKEKYYEVNDTYPKIKAHLVTFDTREAAEQYVEEQIEEALPNPWRR